MSGVVPAIPRLKFTNATGVPVVSGSVAVYLAGTNTLANTYQDKALTILNNNPVPLDGNGEALFWLDPSLTYKFLLKDANNATVTGWPVDNILGGGNSPTLQQSYVDTFSGDGSQTVFTLSAAPGNIKDTNVYVGGVYQKKSAYTLAGSALTFVAAPASGTNNIEVTYYVLLDFTGLAATIAGYSAAAAASASDAQTSALAASTSETNAAGSVTAINNRIYPGTYTTAPTTRPDGSARQAGDEYFSATANLRYTFNGATWVASDINTANLAAPSGSTLVGTIQAGTGAAARTLQAIGRERFSVLGFAGVVGNGINDDSTGIQAAIAAIPDNSDLLFPSGYTFYIGTALSISSRNSLRLIGEGAHISCAKNIGLANLLGSTDIKITGLNVYGTISTDGYTGNANQGSIVVQTSTDVEIYGNRWYNTAQAAFIQTGAKRVWFHHNACIYTHAGIQTSSAVYTDLSITDNFFLGHAYNITDLGSDDQIAVFGNAGGRCIIARNFIDKQGPTAYNHARAINVSVGAGANADIMVVDNEIQNVITTVGANGRSAIDVEGLSGKSLARVSVRGNHVTNCNLPILLGAFASNVLISSNNISTSVVVSGLTNSGNGIQVSTGGSDAEAVISNNLIQGCGSHGISASSSPKIVISANFVKGSTARGISVDTCNDAVLSANLSTGNQDGILVNNCQRISIAGNTSTSNTQYGLRTQGTTSSGTVIGNTLKLNTTADYSDSSGTFDLVIQGNYGVGTYGVSSTTTTPKNLCGTATFATAATKAVTFSRAEADTSYRIAVGAEANETVWVSSKTTTGFTLNSSNAASTAVVDWVLVR